VPERRLEVFEAGGASGALSSEVGVGVSRAVALRGTRDARAGGSARTLGLAALGATAATGMGAASGGSLRTTSKFME
jgi:hypothetical protein